VWVVLPQQMESVHHVQVTAINVIN
jgi:hypothetical protein